MRVILIRHYKTVSNEEGRIIGWGDSPPSADWQRDIDFVDERLREREIRFERVYSSALERSRQTARLHADLSGLNGVVESAQLNEINYGSLQAKKKGWVVEAFPLHKKNPDLVYPQGESFRQMQQRCTRFLASLVETCQGRTILLVSHAGVIRGLVSHFLGLDYTDNLARGIPFHYIGDMLFDGADCVRYDEFGELSGFAGDGAIALPWVNPANR